MKAALFVGLSLVAGCDSCSRAPSTEAASSVVDAGPRRDPDAGPVNATTIPTASVAAAVNPQHLPPYTGPTGSIEGKIRVTGAPATRVAETPADFHKCAAAAEMFGSSFREGKAGSGPRTLGDAVVAITGYTGFYVQENLDAELLTIEGCAFSRRTVTATFGQRIEVKNQTREFWTPLLEPAPNPVMMMATPGGDAVKLYPKRPGHYHLVDHDRKWAKIDLYVFLHPLHTSSDGDGNYRIDGVPIGKVKVNTSHPRIPDAEASQEIEVKSGVVHHVDLVLDNKPREAGPEDPVDPPPQLR